LESQITVVSAGISAPKSACYQITKSPFSLVIQSLSSNVTKLRLDSKLDYESCSYHYVTIKAWDQTGHYLYCTPLISVSDANDAPYFQNKTYNRAVYEDSPQDTNVGAPITARDQDTSSELSYSVVGGTGASLFGIKLCSGQIYVDTSKLSYPKSNYTLYINVTDNGSPIKTAQAKVNITVIFVNHAPKFTNSTMYVYMYENQPVGTATFPSTLPYYDQDVGDKHYWTLVGGSTSAFAINYTTGVLKSKLVRRRMPQ
jgi:protocadherin Fat 1/2/3